MDTESTNAKVGIEAEGYVQGLFHRGYFDEVFPGMDSYDAVGLTYFDDSLDRPAGQRDPLKTIAVEFGIDGIIRMRDHSYPVNVDVKYLGEGQTFKFQLLKDSGIPGTVYNEMVKYLVFASPKDGYVYFVDRARVVEILDGLTSAYSLVPGKTQCQLANVVSSGFGQLSPSKPLSLWWAVKDHQKIAPAILCAYRFTTETRKETIHELRKRG